MLKYTNIITKIAQLLSFGPLPIPPITPAEGLLALPPEVLLLISDFLPLHSTTCLALSSRVFNNLLGQKSREALQDTATRLEFLFLLSKDRPLHFLCNHCVRFHSVSKIYVPRYPAPERLRSAYGPCHERNAYHESMRNYTPMVTSPIQFGFPHIQSAMKRHNNGSSDGVPLSAFSFTGLLEASSGYKIIISVEARIVEGSFLYRVHQCFLLPRHCCRDFADTDGFYSSTSCRHKGTLAISMLNRILDGHHPFPRYEQCRDCCMDYELTGIDCGEIGIAISLTRWLDFGAGLCPDDPKWKNHVSYVQGYRPFLRGHVRGSIRESFEGASGESLENLKRAYVGIWSSWLGREKVSSVNQAVWLQRGRDSDSNWWTLAKYMSGLES